MVSSCLALRYLNTVLLHSGYGGFVWFRMGKAIGKNPGDCSSLAKPAVKRGSREDDFYIHYFGLH